jgi:N-acylneuraminate cytidylyltransferase
VIKLAIIPARGGSKRIPRKNIKDFLGKPIIAYSIEAALQSGLFDEVMVSTDDEEIASVAREYGAKVPFLRSPQCSDDYATIFDVIQEVLEHYQAMEKKVEYVCCVFATAPFVTAEMLKQGYEKLLHPSYDSAFAIQRYKFPIFRALKQDNEGRLAMIWPEHQNTRSQDLPESFHDAGQFYWAKTAALLEEGTFYTQKSTGILLSDLQAIDIDTLEDWKVAEEIFLIAQHGISD